MFLADKNFWVLFPYFCRRNEKMFPMQIIFRRCSDICWRYEVTVYIAIGSSITRRRKYIINIETIRYSRAQAKSSQLYDTVSGTITLSYLLAKKWSPRQPTSQWRVIAYDGEYWQMQSLDVSPRPSPLWSVVASAYCQTSAHEFITCGFIISLQLIVLEIVDRIDCPNVEVV